MSSESSLVIRMFEICFQIFSPYSTNVPQIGANTIKYLRKYNLSNSIHP